jgi:hypothetical protein
MAGEPGEPRVSVESAWLVVALEAGAETLATGARPEGAMESLYTVRFRYEGETAADGLQITLAIPEGVHYVAGSATGPGAEVAYSVDGGHSFGAPGTLALPAGEPGTGVEMRRATPPDYSHIRWTLPGVHPSGRAGLVSFRARPVEAGTEEETQ